MTTFSAIDPSKLPAPAVIKTPSYEELLSQMKAAVLNDMPELKPYLDLESEPMVKVLQVCAYHRMLDRLSFNDGARACMLALARGSDLDQLAAFWGVQRLVVQKADTSVAPPIAEILEDDTAFRARVQLSLEGHSTAGPRGAYIFHALSASGDLKDASVVSPTPGQVVVTVLGREGDGTPSAEALAAVTAKLNHADIRPLTDQVTVQPARIVPLSVVAKLYLFEEMDAEVILNASSAALKTHLSSLHRLGRDVTVSGLYAALHQPGVQRVRLTTPEQDFTIAQDSAAYCPPNAISIQIGARDV